MVLDSNMFPFWGGVITESPVRVTIPPTSIDMHVSGVDLSTTMWIYGVTGIALFFIYCISRRHHPRIFSPRKRLVPSSTPRELPFTYFGWILPLFSPARDDEILKYAGLDAYLSIRLGVVCLKLFFFLFLCGGGILIPLYITQGNGERVTDPIETLSLVYMVGSLNGDLLIIPCLMVYLFTAVGVYLIHREHSRLVYLKREYFSTEDASSFSVLVQRIPPELATVDALYRYFESLYPGSVNSVNIVVDDLASLRDAVERRESIVTALEDAQLGNRKSVAPSTMIIEKRCTWLVSRGCCFGVPCYACCGVGERVDSVQFLSKELAKLNIEVTMEKQRILDSIKMLPSVDDIDARQWTYDGRSTSNVNEAIWLLGPHSELKAQRSLKAAFVTFNNKTTALAIGRCMDTGEADFIVTPVPEHQDLIWDNLGAHPLKVRMIQIGIFILLAFLLVIFGGITSSIALATNLQSMRQGWKSLDQLLVEYPISIRFFSNVSPFLLVIAFSLVPPLLNAILEQRYMIAESEIENNFFVHYYVFLVLQIFLFYQISGALLNVFTQTIESPGQLLEILSRMLPNNAGFFMQVLIIKTCWSLPFELLRGGDFLVAKFVRPVFIGTANTRRQKRSHYCACRTLKIAGDACHGASNATECSILAICVAYSIISPLISGFAMLYFLVRLLVQRYLLLYVYVKKYESGGSNLTNIVYAYLFAFILLQFLMVGTFSMYGRYILSAFLSLPIIFTVSYGCVMSKEDGRQQVSLADVRRFDIKAEHNRHNILSEQQHSYSYIHPLMSTPGVVAPDDESDLDSEDDMYSSLMDHNKGFSKIYFKNDPIF